MVSDGRKKKGWKDGDNLGQHFAGVRGRRDVSAVEDGSISGLLGSSLTEEETTEAKMNLSFFQVDSIVVERESPLTYDRPICRRIWFEYSISILITSKILWCSVMLVVDCLPCLLVLLIQECRAFE